MRLFVVLLALVGLLVCPSASAFGTCHEVTITRLTQGVAVVEFKIVCYGPPAPIAQAEPPSPTPPPDVTCQEWAVILGEPVGKFCTEATDDDDSGDPERITPAMIAEAFRRLPLPPAQLNVQPPNGRTLVNFATNFFTDRDEFTRTVRLLGQRVDLRITPAQFTWRFDDGETATTTSPGSPYPELDVTHEYRSRGGVSPRVDTTYTAVFRVGGRGWQPVPGSVTIPGEEVALDVVEASPLLVGYN
jgi:hypothetical protein